MVLFQVDQPAHRLMLGQLQIDPPPALHQIPHHLLLLLRNPRRRPSPPRCRLGSPPSGPHLMLVRHWIVQSIIALHQSG